QRLDLAEARLAPALAAGAARHRTRLQAVLDRLVRRSPELALAHARARLERVDDRAERALRVDLQRRQDTLAQLGRRLVVARDAGLERARVIEARRRDRFAALTVRLTQARARDDERRRERLDALANLLATLSYRAVLDRGFVLVRDAEGRSLRHAEAASEAGRLSLQFADGTVEAIPAKADRSPKRVTSRTGGKAAPERQGTLFDA
ncbi:MAG: exodeoxyribonuclease VII large subunit, partial [Actinomycetospora chiangmaiensis]|nr:exodeoxyribonuclease VII large subunit [Actinomycetospora chiangmaiensis]